MTRPDRVERQWGALVDWLRQRREDMGLHAQLSLEEAQRYLAGAQADPLTAHEIEVLVAMAARRRVNLFPRSARDNSEMFFSTDVRPVEVEWAASAAIVSLAGGAAGEGLRWRDDWWSDVNSLTVDTRPLQLPLGACDVRWGSLSTASIICDVWSELDELTEVGNRSGREAGTGGCSDARLDAGYWESTQCALSVPDWCDFAGYGDEETEELRRN